jgi:hypothetical protein
VESFKTFFRVRCISERTARFPAFYPAEHIGATNPSDLFGTLTKCPRSDILILLLH